MTKYINSDNESRIKLSEEIIKSLDDAGFYEVNQRVGAERVFSRYVKNNISIMVYSSISFGGVIRNVGKDAIRITALYTSSSTGKTFPVYKGKRVNRVGEIEDIRDRMLERMREAWRVSVKNEKCRHCGAEMVLSKKGKQFCGETCWLDK